MSMSYDGKALIPAPFVNITKEIQINGDGEKVGTLFLITLQGKALAHKGSPRSDGSWHTTGGYPADETIAADSAFTSLLRKQEAIRSLFANEGRNLTIQPWDGAAPITCNPRVRRIAFPSDHWFNRFDYTVELECDVLYMNGTSLYEENATITNYKISKSSEEWAIEAADEDFLTYRLTRNLSATGKRFYNESNVLVKEAWKQAYDYLTTQVGLGIDMTRITDSQLNLDSDYRAYNYVRSERISKKDGVVNFSESWLIFDPRGGEAAIHKEVVNTRIEENGRATVTIDGTVTGLQVSNNTTQVVSSTKYANATAKYNAIAPSIFASAETESGINLHGTPLSQVVGRNTNAGVITYSHTYDNRPSSQITNSKSERFTQSFVLPADVFASIGVLARTAGPILQSMGSKTGTSKTLNIEAVMPCASQDGTVTKPNTDAVVATYAPVATTVLVASDTEQWDHTSGRYGRNTVWTYEA